MIPLIEGLNSSVYQNGPKKTRSRNASINASIAKMDNIHHKTTDGIFWKGTTDDEMDGKDQGIIYIVDVHSKESQREF